MKRRIRRSRRFRHFHHSLCHWSSRATFLVVNRPIGSALTSSGAVRHPLSFSHDRLFSTILSRLSSSFLGTTPPTPSRTPYNRRRGSTGSIQRERQEKKRQNRSSAVFSSERGGRYVLSPPIHRVPTVSDESDREGETDAFVNASRKVASRKLSSPSPSRSLSPSLHFSPSPCSASLTHTPYTPSSPPWSPLLFSKPPPRSPPLPLTSST
jgi:hypothetical protein